MNLLTRIAKRTGVTVVAIGLLLTLWYIAIGMDWLSSGTLPEPTDTLSRFGTMLRDGSLLGYTWQSLRRVLVGLSLGIGFGLLGALLITRQSVLSSAVRRLVELLRPIPPIAWIPIAIIWFGIGFRSSIAVVVIGVFFPFVITAADAFGRAADDVRNVANLYGIRGLRFVRVATPAALPELASSVRLAVGLGWTSIIAAELVGGSEGLGYLIQQSRLLLQMDVVLVCMLTIGLVGYALSGAVRIVERWAIRRWRVDLVDGNSSQE